MATETDKYETQAEREARHSAFEEFSRDERRPAVILLSALLLAAVFFAIGIMVGRWTAEPGRQHQQQQHPSVTQTASPQTPPTSNTGGTPQQTASAQPAATTTAAVPAPTDDKKRRFALLVEGLKSSEAARSLVESMERAGYRDVRTRAGATSVPESSFSVLIGRYTRDEAEAEATRLRARGGPRLKNVRVIEDPGG
ncbi:MAG TPA: hypothetical protein VGX92_03440 [Pyrinomonadaceae bacterium]|jgi:cytoskeletal protein RodZ|nr:hypothetical protein [Pyrinomonadaceae bacterium]